MAGLLDFWQETHAGKFEWGKTDCAQWLASYVEARTGRHPSPDLVGSYDTFFGARRLVIEHGGLVQMASRFLSAYPSGQEVGVYDLYGRATCGISRGEFTAFRSNEGIALIKDARLIQGWDLQCRS